MSTSGIVVVLIVIIVILVNIFKSKSKAPEDESKEAWPYFPKPTMSRREQVLYFRLVKALPEQIVLAQVQLSRILGVKKGYSFKFWYNRINRMSADFVVCNKDSRVVAVIELDDSSHEREDRKIADVKKNKALTSAGIRIVRWQASALPDEDTIKAIIAPNRSEPTLGTLPRPSEAQP